MLLGDAFIEATVSTIGVTDTVLVVTPLAAAVAVSLAETSILRSEHIPQLRSQWFESIHSGQYTVLQRRRQPEQAHQLASFVSTHASTTAEDLSAGVVMVVVTVALVERTYVVVMVVVVLVLLPLVWILGDMAAVMVRR